MAKAALVSRLHLQNTSWGEPSAPRQGHDRVPFNRGEFSNHSLSFCAFGLVRSGSVQRSKVTRLAYRLSRM